MTNDDGDGDGGDDDGDYGDDGDGGDGGDDAGGDGGDGGDGGVDEGGKEHGDGYNMQMGAIIHLLTRFERCHYCR